MAIETLRKAGAFVGKRVYELLPTTQNPLVYKREDSKQEADARRQRTERQVIQTLEDHHNGTRRLTPEELADYEAMERQIAAGVPPVALNTVELFNGRVSLITGRQILEIDPSA